MSLDGQLEQAERQVHALAPLDLEREPLAELGGLDRAAVHVERRRLLGHAAQPLDGLREARGVAGGDARERDVLEREQTAGGGLGVVSAAPQQLRAHDFAATAVGVEHLGHGHLLGEAGAATGGFERVEEGALAAGERLGQMREGGFPEVRSLLVEREVGRCDVARGIHPGSRGRSASVTRCVAFEDIVPSAGKVHTRWQANEDEGEDTWT